MQEGDRVIWAVMLKNEEQPAFTVTAWFVWKVLSTVLKNGLLLFFREVVAIL